MKKLLIIIALCGASFLTVVYADPAPEAPVEGQASTNGTPEDNSNGFDSNEPTEQSLLANGEFGRQPQDETEPANQINPSIYNKGAGGGGQDQNIPNNGGEQYSTVEATEPTQNGNNVVDDNTAQVENADLNRGSASGQPAQSDKPQSILGGDKARREARRKQMAAKRALKKAEAEALRAEARQAQIEKAGNLLSDEDLAKLGKRSSSEVFFDDGAIGSKEILARGDEEEYVPNPKELEEQSQNQSEGLNQSEDLSNKIKELKTKIKDTSWWKFRTKSGDRKLLSKLEDEQKKLSENPEDTLEPDEEPQGMMAGEGLLGEIEKFEKKIKDTSWWKFRTKAEDRKLLSQLRDASQKRNEYLSKNFTTKSDKKERFEGDINLLQRNIEELRDYRDGALQEELKKNGKRLEKVNEAELEAQELYEGLENMDKNDPEYQSKMAAYEKESKELEAEKKRFQAQIEEAEAKKNKINYYMNMNAQERANALIDAVNKEVGELREAFNPEESSLSRLNDFIKKVQNFADILNKDQATGKISDQKEKSLEKINDFLELLENERDKRISSYVDTVNTTSERPDYLESDLIESQKKLMYLRKHISERIEKFSDSPEKQEELKSISTAIDNKQNILMDAQIEASRKRVQGLAAKVEKFRTNYENGTRTESEFKSLEQQLLHSINSVLSVSIDRFSEQKNLLGENNANYDQKIEAIKKIKKEAESALDELNETNPVWFKHYFKRRRLGKKFGSLQDGPAPQTGSFADWNRLTQKGKENLTPDELQAYKDTISKELKQQQSEVVEEKQQGLFSKMRNWFRSKPKTRQDIVNEINYRLNESKFQQQPQKPTFWSRFRNIFRSEPKTGEEVLGLPRYEPVEEPASEPDSEGSTRSALEDNTELGTRFKRIGINKFIGGLSGTTEH